jgi:hypothetical protein
VKGDKMHVKYPPADYAARLDKCIVRYAGELCQIHVETQSQFWLYDILNKGKALHKVVPKDARLDISTIPLGWFNTNAGYCAYSKRLPHRMYKQGIYIGGRQSNVKVSALLPAGLQPDAPEQIFCEGFVDSYHGKFPSFDQGVKLITSGSTKSVALTKDIAIVRKDKLFLVYLKEDEIGWIAPGTRIVKVPNANEAWVYSKYLAELNWIVE